MTQIATGATPNARQIMFEASHWLGEQDEALSYGLRSVEDALRLYEYWKNHTFLPELADRDEDGLDVASHRILALGYDPLVDVNTVGCGIINADMPANPTDKKPVFPLLVKSQYLASSGKALLVGLGGTMVGLLHNNPTLAALGAIIIGAFLAQALPIWREIDGAGTSQDKKHIALIAKMQPWVNLMWYTAIALTLVMGVVQLVIASMPGGSH